MSQPSFERQSDAPLYPKVLWNRPVSRTGAGRLLVLGGHSGEFSAVTTFYELAMSAGAGECRVVLPSSLLKLLAGMPEANFVPSSPSGSLGREALAEVLELAEDADSLVLGSNLSNNSETTILLERLLQESKRPAVLFDEALVSLQHDLPNVASESRNLLVVTMPEVFKLAGVLGVPINIRPDGGLINKLEIIRDVAASSKCDYALYGSELIVASDGKLVVTHLATRQTLPPALFAAILAVFWTQNQSNRLEGLAAGSYVLGRLTEAIKANEHLTTTQIAGALRGVLTETE